MKGLFIRLDHVGDVFLCTPLIRCLSQGGYRMDLIVPPESAPLFEGNPHVNAVYDMKEVCADFPQGWGAMSRWMRRGKYDILILPLARPRQLLFASFFSGIPRRVAMWSGVWGRLTLHQCLRSGFPERVRPFADIMLDCARHLRVPTEDTRLELHLDRSTKDRVGRMVAARVGDRVLVGIHPGCGGSSCNMPAMEYGRLAEMLLRRGDLVVVVTGVEKERHLLERWPLSVLESDRMWNAVGSVDILELAALIGSMTVFVAPSTGPLHLANWAGTATVSPFCAYPPVSAEVWGNNNGRGIALAPDPSHCTQWRRKHRGQCDFSGLLTAEHLYNEVIRLLPN